PMQHNTLVTDARIAHAGIGPVAPIVCAGAPAPRPGSTSVILAVLAIGICSLLIAVAWLSPFTEVQPTLSAMGDAASQRMGEYLFFIGTTHCALLLLRRKKWIKATLVFGAGIAWVSLHAPVTHFVENLGGDSFAEAQAFDLDEAVFWLKTLHAAISPRLNELALLCYLAVAVGSYLALRALLRWRPMTARHDGHVKFSIAAIIIAIAVHHTVSRPAMLFIENTQVYTETRKNFSNPAPALLPGGADIDLLVYIGESTSAMNMGIYGYPRDTTPALQKLRDTDEQLIVFKNVFSTHTHTSPSLLEAFSFGVQQDDAYLPINRRRRLSLVDLLEANRIRTTLVSNQGQTGTWNMASSIIFGKARSIYSGETRKLGNNDDKVPKPWDHLFFRNSIEAAFDPHARHGQIAFFHSYSGHGGYHDNIPDTYRIPVDQRFGPIRSDSATESGLPFRSRIEEYDAAIRYIDQAVAHAIGYVRSSPRPTAFVYFSDHGDAPFAGRAHDSSQFIHEMARVPFLVYFNDAARARFPETFEKYRRLAANRHDATLAQLPSTLLDLLQLRIDPRDNDKITQTPVIGEEAMHPPIVVRETAAGVTYVNINHVRTAAVPARAVQPIDRSDHASRAYAAARSRTHGASQVCYRGVDSASKLMRSRLVSDCIEVAVAVLPDGSIAIADRTGRPTGLALRDVLEVAAINQMGVWIHAPGLHARAPCEALQRQLGERAAVNHPVLVEFPAGSYRNRAELGGCAAGLARMGVATSYFVAGGDAVSCSASLAGGRPFSSKRSCLRLQKDVAAAWRSGLFTDIGFDYRGLRAMQSLREAGGLRWNTWQMRPEQFSGEAAQQFKMTILSAGNGDE
ncbi:MAG TPA: sulfatase-like hydrolase/transferase, partial [Ramlibacter sp.]|nr:sulfatase-like hydrolase/transferase [Ramlibacter sp.]